MIQANSKSKDHALQNIFGNRSNEIGSLKHSTIECDPAYHHRILKGGERKVLWTGWQKQNPFGLNIDLMLLFCMQKK